MSRISENIRKIIKAWGGKTTGNGISDALSDLYNNLPFGTKTEMVEIVPEQSVTTTSPDGGTGHFMIDQWQEEAIAIQLKENTKYIVKINGVEYFCTSVTKDDTGDTLVKYVEIGAKFDGNNYDFSEFPFVVITTYGGEAPGTYMQWLGVPPSKQPLGETITLAIYEEQEVVQQIDTKFVGKTIVFTFTADDNSDSGFAATCNLSFDECREAIKSHNLNAIAVIENFGGGYGGNADLIIPIGEAYGAHAGDKNYQLMRFEVKSTMAGECYIAWDVNDGISVEVQ